MHYPHGPHIYADVVQSLTIQLYCELWYVAFVNLLFDILREFILAMAPPQDTVKSLMSKFESVSQDTLEDPMCPCCYVEYGKSPADGVEAERPIKTSCNHVFGHLCLEQWLPNKNCPLCRRRLIDPLDLQPSVATMVAAGDDVVLCLLHTQRTLQELTLNNRVPPGVVLAVGQSYLDLRTNVDRFGINGHILSHDHLPIIEENRWLRLYQQLYESGASLVEPSRGSRYAAYNQQITTEPDGRLSWLQKYALFRELQRRSAYNYPGMRQFFGPMPEILIHWTLRQSGLCWYVDHAWTTADGTVLWGRSGRGTYQASDRLEGGNGVNAETAQ